MPETASICRLVLPMLFAMAWVQTVNAGSSDLTPIARTELCVTKGAIEVVSGTHLEVRAPEMRAVVLHPTEQRVEARLTYLGPTKKVKKLGSGELRRQFGLKLRAANSCNLVYAMWRIEPKSELVVSVKSNPGMSTHAQCGTHGYTNIKAERASPAPRLQKGDHHVLRAEMQQSKMQVWIDEKLVWEGDVGQTAMTFDGPVGIRTDNGRFKFELLTTVKSGPPIPCHGSNEDE
jgi:hypothetical protein